MDSILQLAARALFSAPGLVAIVAVLSVYLVYLVAYEPFNYWKKRGVPQIKMKYPLVGSFVDRLQKPPSEFISNVYNEFPDERFVGMYRLRTPAIVVKDPELVEAVFIKDFSVFAARADAEADTNVTKVSKHLLNLTDEHWKTMRHKLTPTFTSGKLKGMHSQLVDCTLALMKYMKKLEDGRPFEVRDVTSRLTMDVIASCAFGLSIDSINEPDSEFRQMGLAIFKPSLKSKFMFAARSVLPGWGVQIMRRFLAVNSSKRIDFFEKVVNDTLEYRKKNNVTRADFLQLMNEVKEKDEEMVRNKGIDAGHPHLFDQHSLLSNAFVFFLAGFETTASTVSYAMYELALNPDVQNRAYEEVAAVMKEHNGQPDYDACQKMKYLEMVIAETLRIYPPAASISRKTGAEYKIPGTDVVISKGTIVTIPIYPIHHDPQYYPDPEKFIPERFDEEKDAIRKGTYMPFSGGPRICIGARFAKLEAKVCLAMILQNYQIVKCDQTRVPLKFDKNSFLLAPEGGIWLSVKPRAKSN